MAARKVGRKNLERKTARPTFSQQRKATAIRISWTLLVAVGLALFNAGASDARPVVAYIIDETSNRIQVVDLDSFTSLPDIIVSSSSFGGIAASPDGRRVYVPHGSVDLVSIINTITNKMIGSFSVESPTSLAFHPDGTKMFVTNGFDNEVLILDSRTHAVLKTIPVGTQPTEVAIHPAGTFLYVTIGTDRQLVKIDLTTETIVSTINLSDEAASVAVLPDGTRHYVSVRGGELYVIDATDTVVTTVPLSGLNKDAKVAVVPDGSLVFVSSGGSSSGEVHAIDTATNAILETISLGASHALGTSVHLNGSRVYVTDRVNLISIDTSTLAVAQTKPIQSGSGEMAVATALGPVPALSGSAAALLSGLLIVTAALALRLSVRSG